MMRTPVNIFYQSDRAAIGETWRGNIANPSDPYAGFSLCHYTGDDPAHMSACLRSLADCFGITPDDVIVPRQVHGTEIAVITSEDNFSRDITDGADAVICTVNGKIIGVNTADCIPVILIDEETGIIAAVHAGWRGAVAGIAGMTAFEMHSLGAREITAFIGSGICCNCFEVGEEVASRFPERFVVRRPGQKPHVDLPAFVADDLRRSGVADVNMIGKCTRCNPGLYFSARAIGIASGRNYTFALLK